MQKGSLVEEDYLRFDFSHQKSVTKDEIAELEKEINEIILQNSESTTRVMPIKQALESGATAMFGEKYGEEVRVLSIGSVDNHGSYSIEFCGGTHVARTGDIGLFKIIKESAVASGVRRIEAVTGEKAVAYVQNREGIINGLQDKLKTSPEDFDNRISALMNEKKSLESQISDLKKKIALGGGASSGGSSVAVQNINGVNFIGQKLEGIEAKDLRGLVDEYKKKYDNAVILLIAENDGKATVAAGISDKLTAKFSAVDIVKNAVETLGGKGGGGRPDFAQGGAPSAEGAYASIEAIKKII
jgi:alanyl-tRNA synthetase